MPQYKANTMSQIEATPTPTTTEGPIEPNVNSESGPSLGGENTTPTSTSYSETASFSEPVQPNVNSMDGDPKLGGENTDNAAVHARATVMPQIVVGMVLGAGVGVAGIL